MTSTMSAESALDNGAEVSDLATRLAFWRRHETTQRARAARHTAHCSPKWQQVPQKAGGHTFDEWPSRTKGEFNPKKKQIQQPAFENSWTLASRRNCNTADHPSRTVSAGGTARPACGHASKPTQAEGSWLRCSIVSLGLRRMHATR